MIDLNSDLVVGVKVRIGNEVTFEDDGLEPLRRARRAAEECELPLMVHISFGPPEIDGGARVLEARRHAHALLHGSSDEDR